MARKKASAQETTQDSPKKEEERFSKISQAAFLDAMVKRKGNVTAACKLAEVSRAQVYVWRREDPDFEALYKDTRKQLEEFLFEKACEFGEMGDITALIFSLKALNRARFDDAYARQERAFERGMTPEDGANAVPTRVLLVREPGPHEMVPAAVAAQVQDERKGVVQ